MKRIGSILLAGLYVFLASSPAPAIAQSDDPSEIFLKAYMTSQQGEKLEHENQFKAALAKYRFAGSLIEELRKSHGDWQPAIVEYRGRKISESVLRVQGKASAQKALLASSAPMFGNAAPLPQNSGLAQPSIEIATPPEQLVEQMPNDSAIQNATRKLHEKVDQLQRELQKSRDKIAAVEKEKESLRGKLDETNSKLEAARKDVQKSNDAERQVRDQLTQAQESLRKIESSADNGTKQQEALLTEVAQLKRALVIAEEGRAAAEKAKDEATTKASKEIASTAKERDDALAQLKGAKEAQQRVEVLVAENTDLKQKLADAEKSVRELSADKPKKEQELAEVKGQIAQLQQQLAASQKQNRDFEAMVANLRSQLDDADTQLDKAKLTGASAEETARLTKENQILRNIVVREREEEARRDQAKKLMLAEFDKLKIKSDTLNQQIELLAQPVTKLSDEELALLRQPVIAISDSNPSVLKASFTYAKKSDENRPAAVDPPSANEPGGFKPAVPDDLLPVAHAAKDNFDRGKYRSAEKQYQEILTKSPNNLYSLSNLGVVYFRTGKFKAAELTLKKAVAIAPKDEFAHTTLGIVYYRQAKFDDALTELTKSLAINPQSATAHNYLGITASQKGWQEAAEKEMLQAIAANPDYADAHFNLAVIYATEQPPAKDLAKKHYAKATSLGSQPDPALERLLH
jgi:Flp pilus assembly protein TadD